jgi:hypothetical protein
MQQMKGEASNNLPIRWMMDVVMDDGWLSSSPLSASLFWFLLFFCLFSVLVVMMMCGLVSYVWF